MYQPLDDGSTCASCHNAVAKWFRDNNRKLRYCNKCKDARDKAIKEVKARK